MGANNFADSFAVERDPRAGIGIKEHAVFVMRGGEASQERLWSPVLASLYFYSDTLSPLVFAISKSFDSSRVFIAF